MNSTLLKQMMGYIDERGFAIDSVIIIRNGYIVLEEYPNPRYNQGTLHELYSVTKSFTSTLIGIAIQQGFIESTDQKVLEFFPEKTIANLDARKQSMTLEHLLTMTAGLEWDEWTYPYMDPQGKPDYRNTYIQMILSFDSIQFVLDQPMAHDPGTHWAYNSGASHLLSAIIERTTQHTTFDFASEFLFKPLGISEVTWTQHPQGPYYGGHGLYLKPGDMAKLGYLYLEKGTWDGKQIVPPEWVAKSTETHSRPWKDTGYGYQWWTSPTIGVYEASGLYGQQILVAPNYNMVVVFTATIKTGPNPEPEILQRFILPAAIDDATHTPGVDTLAASILIALLALLMLAGVYWLVRTRRAGMKMTAKLHLAQGDVRPINGSPTKR